MEKLKNRIQNQGRIIGTEIVNVDIFLNHQIDVQLFNDIGQEFKRRFENETITKILTIESSGIGLAAIASQYFGFVPVVFARKVESKLLDNEVYLTEVHSFTKNKTSQIRVSKRYITKEDRVLIIDDFLANGNAVLGLCDIINQASATLCGVGIVIEKSFQPGRKKLLDQGVRLESLARINSISDGIINFED